jgi:hypothetical protein
MITSGVTMRWLLLFYSINFLFLSEISFAKNIKIILPIKSDIKNNHYLSARNAIGMVESNNNPCAKNKLTSASGKYQFMKAWNNFFKKKYGRSWTSVIPSCKSTQKIRTEMGLVQDRMFDLYYDFYAGPWIYKNRGRGYSDLELLAIYHRQGEGGANRYIRTMEDYAAGKWGNSHVKVHVRRVVNAANPVTIIASLK